MRRPFHQLPFDQVPETPPRPHGYAATEALEIAIAWPAGASTRVAVRRLGRGPPLLLVHGLMTSSYSFRYVFRGLAERFTVYAPDLPGAGRSEKPDTDYHPEELARAIGALIEALDIRGAAVIGNSMGGYLCMQLALEDPGAISRLVNLHSPGLATPRVWALHATLRLTPGSEWLLGKLIARDPERWVHRNVHYYDETLKSREEHREYAAPLRTRAGVRAFSRNLSETLDPRAMRRFERELRRRSGRFPIPLMLLYAKTDPMVPPEIGRRLARLIPSASLVELERGSHFAHVDAPDLFLGAIEPFLGPG